MSNDDDISKDGGAILRCETCFVLFKDQAKKLAPCRAAAKLSTEETALKEQHYEAAECLLKCALTAMKAKSAAMHHENLVAFAFSVGG